MDPKNRQLRANGLPDLAIGTQRSLADTGGRATMAVLFQVSVPAGGNHWLNGGYQFLLTEELQSDLNAGLGLDNRAGDYRLGLGYSMRF